MAHHYIDESIEAASFVAGGTLSLTGVEAKHAVTVSRMRVGESIRIGDGAGHVAEAVVTAVQPGLLEARVESATTTPAPTPRIVLVQALAKGDRDELAVQAATELGVDEIVPWQAARSVSRWEGVKIQKGRDRWGSIVREASKQSLREWMPAVGDLVTTKGLAARAADSLMILLEPTSAVPLTTLDIAGDRDVVIVVGPEGGISPAEIDVLVGAGARTAVLGTSVLRTSTAGPAAVAVLNGRLGRW